MKEAQQQVADAEKAKKKTEAKTTVDEEFEAFIKQQLLAKKRAKI